MPRQKVTTSHWFDTQAEEAARFYVSVFSKFEHQLIKPRSS